MSSQHNYLEEEDDFSEFYNNPLYKRVSELTPHERKYACPPPPLPKPRRDNHPRVVTRKSPRQHPIRVPSPRPPSPRRDADAVRASIRRNSFVKPRQTPNKEDAREPEAPEPEAANAPILRTVADRNFQQNVARVLGPEHVGKYENCADMAEKAREELEDKPEGSHRLGQIVKALIGFPDDPITDKVDKEFQEIMDDEEMMLELHEGLEEDEALEGDEGLEEGEILDDDESVDIADWKKPKSRKLATREQGGEDHDADLADER
ncbi:hypothetical protein H9Q69_008134 [Fusarium xylarioides]|nr:hypothetical protein H9Q69_008134 [Fusarium xylarioides]